MGVSLFFHLAVFVFCSIPITSSSSPKNYANAKNMSLTDQLSNTTFGESVDVVAFAVEEGHMEMEENLIYLHSDETYAIRIFGSNLASSRYSLTFTESSSTKGSSCDDLRSTPIYESFEVSRNFILFHISLPWTDGRLHFCIREENQDFGVKSDFIHQGHDPWMSLRIKSKSRRYILPLWLQISVVIILLLFSGLFSGLNLGLMSLDQTELNIMIASGTEKEKRYAKVIKPLRKRGNYLLCTILLGNVLVNNCLTILLDDLTGSGWMAIAGATFAIVVFGEILPQALCSRHGLAVGAHTIWFTKTFMFLTFPLSFPISLILDKILGEEIGYVYNRDRLRELLRLTEKDIGLEKDEVNIITGALELSKKTVGDIMTKIDDVFMIEYNAILDFEMLTGIINSGYTRIPVYEEDRSNVVALLNTKDLALVDPDNKSPLKDITAFYKRPLLFVFEDMRLDVILQDFKKGGSHMAMVQRVVNEGPGDPYYQVIGLVTLEDVIEEIIQAEINDEFDIISDNKNRQPRGKAQKDYSIFNLPSQHNMPRLTPQLQLASFQFLSSTLTPFRIPHMSERILHKLMGQNVVFEYKQRTKDQVLYLFQHGKAADYFILIVQGRVLVQSGKEHLTYESGSFSYFGLQSLLVEDGSGVSKEERTGKYIVTQCHLGKDQQQPCNGQGNTSHRNASEVNLVPATSPFHPDYTVRALTDLQYIRITRDQYYIAWKVSQLEQELQKNKPADSSITDDTFESEWRKSNNFYDSYHDNIEIGKPGKLSSQGQLNLPEVHGQPGGILQSLRRTFGFSYMSPSDPPNQSFEGQATSPDRSALVAKGGSNQNRGTTWTLKDGAAGDASFKKRAFSLAAPFQSRSTDQANVQDRDKSSSPIKSARSVKTITPVKRIDSNLRVESREEKVGEPQDRNSGFNVIPRACLGHEPGATADASKMETEALLEESLVEVKVLKP